MMTTLRYENHLGVSLDLTSGGYSLHENDLLDYDWDYTLVGRPGGTESILKQASRQSAKYKATIGVRGEEGEYQALMNALLAITEPDVIAQSPGKLWRNDQYIRCYVMSGSFGVRAPRFAVKQLGIVAVDPFWTIETTQTFYSQAGSIAGGKKYNLKYPYRFGTGYSNDTLYNSHYADTPMVLTFFGAATDPSVTIAGHEYAMICELAAGERVEIDQAQRTITKIGTTGARTNLFNSRDKTSDIFQPVPAGNQTVQYYLDSAISIRLIQRRSEPLWT